MLSAGITGIIGILIFVLKNVWQSIKKTFEENDENFKKLDLKTTDLHYSRIAMLEDIKDCKQRVLKLENLKRS